MVVPTYNEADTIGQLLEEVLRLTSADILVVDDSSPDGTAALVSGHPEFGRRVRLLERPEKDGLGGAYRAGFARTLGEGYQKIVQMDADGSHPASAIEPMLARLGSADLVIGSRYVAGGRTVNWSRARRFISRGANTYARLVLGLRVHDATAGFRAWRAEALLAVGALDSQSQGYSFQMENTWRAERRGLVIVEHPITFFERRAGESKVGTGIALETLVKVAGWRWHELVGRRETRVLERR